MQNSPTPFPVPSPAISERRKGIGRSRTTLEEYALPLLAVGSLLLACVITSARKYYWGDELLSYYMASENSFAKMLAEFHDKLNNTPFLYFFLTWNWDKVFGASELSLRLFSSLGIGVALLLTWATIRRTYSFWPTCVGVLSVFCTSHILLSQNAEARMYGLFLAVVAAAVLLYDILRRTPKPTWGLLVLTAGVHAALVNTHLHGVFYSGAILVCLVILDRIDGRFRFKLYVAIILGWLSLLFYLPAFLVQADAGKPRTWLPTPDVHDLLDLYNLTDSSFVYLPLLLILITAGLFMLGQSRVTGTLAGRIRLSKAEVPLLLLAAAFLLVPFGVWVVSRTVKPILYPRYLLPSAVGWSIVLTWLCSRLLTWATTGLAVQSPGEELPVRLPSWVRVAGGFLLVGVLAYPLQAARHAPWTKLPGVDDVPPALAQQYGALPRVITSGEDFIERIHYSPQRAQLFFILDWPSAVTLESGTWPPQEYKHLDAWRRNFPQLFPHQNVTSSDAFLNQYDRFLVVAFRDYQRKCLQNQQGFSDPDFWKQYCDCPQWVNMHLLHNTRYKVTLLNQTQEQSLLLVEKQP